MLDTFYTVFLVPVFSLNVVCTLFNHNYKNITIPAADKSAFHIVFYNTNSIRKGKFHPSTGQEGPEVE
jgi:hypothetical protein